MWVDEWWWWRWWWWRWNWRWWLRLAEVWREKKTFDFVTEIEEKKIPFGKKTKLLKAKNNKYMSKTKEKVLICIFLFFICYFFYTQGQLVWPEAWRQWCSSVVLPQEVALVSDLFTEPWWWRVTGTEDGLGNNVSNVIFF